MQLSIINPLNYPKWDELLLSHPNCFIFHSSNWAKVLNESYGYKPLYFSEINGNRLMTLIPMMEVRSVFTGKRGVSLPFTDYCELIMSEKDSFQVSLGQLIEYGKKAGWKSIGMRSGNTLPQDIPLSSFYYGHTLNLSQSEERIFSQFRKGTKSSINKAIREGVNVNICKSLESIVEFYRLNCIKRREHGLPPQPFYFFKKIYEHILSKNLGIVVLASYNKTIIAGAVYFHFKDNAIYKYAASDKTYQKVRANNLIMWEAIKWYTRNGYKSLCFGRTEPENQGLMQFKNGWGAKEYLIHYYKYDLLKEAFVQDSSRVTGFHNKIFSHMPIPLLKMTGAFLYKHMG
jgi:hypothetical protein